MFNTGSRSFDGGLVGVLNVSPFFSCILEELDSASGVIEGSEVFKTGRRRGCTRADSN